MSHTLTLAVAEMLQGFARVAVAVSGGIDSLTLATIAGRGHDNAAMLHAVSPAVPPEATDRVRDFAAREGWRLQLIDAAEFDRDEYVSNPVNRCFYCKQSLYLAIKAIIGSTSAQIVSGTNADDLHEYRPGLDAARERGVRHPFAELGISKDGIRSIARSLGLGAIAELPPSPCLSSRVETGIGITPSLLRLVHVAENAVRARISASAVRCRIRRAGVVIEIDAATLLRLTQEQKQNVTQAVSAVLAAPLKFPEVSLAPYRIGSAFLVKLSA
jgi:pyridinium-3,5-biscarboxylic acid mononucleotide sulfurtransferase